MYTENGKQMILQLIQCYVITSIIAPGSLYVINHLFIFIGPRTIVLTDVLNQTRSMSFWKKNA